jgi:hypothetical protein
MAVKALSLLYFKLIRALALQSALAAPLTKS